MTQNVVYNYAGGNIIQMVYVTGAGLASNSASAVDVTGSTVTIIPTSSSNNILIYVSVWMQAVINNSTKGYIQLLRNGSIISGPVITGLVGGGFATGAYNTVSFNYLDNPATTSIVTYKLQQYVSSGGGLNGFTANGSVILMEVG